MNDFFHFTKTQPLFWPVLLSLLAHGVFVLSWHPRDDITLTPPQPVQVEFRLAGTPQGDDLPVGGRPAVMPSPNNEAKPVAAPERKATAVAAENKSARKPVLTRADSVPSSAEPASAIAAWGSASANTAGAAAQEKSDVGGAATATGNGAGHSKGEGAGQGNGPKGDTPPGRAHAPAPAYPDTSIEMGEVGSVRLSMTVARDGNVRNVRVTNGSGFPRLDKAAQRAVERWRFKPAQKNGEPVDMLYWVTVRFNLNGSVSTSDG